MVSPEDGEYLKPTSEGQERVSPGRFISVLLSSVPKRLSSLLPAHQARRYELSEEDVQTIEQQMKALGYDEETIRKAASQDFSEADKLLDEILHPPVRQRIVGIINAPAEFFWVSMEYVYWSLRDLLRL